MDSAIRSAQKQVLKVFAKRPGGFALSGDQAPAGPLAVAEGGSFIGTGPSPGRS